MIRTTHIKPVVGTLRTAFRTLACLGFFALPVLASDITPPTLNSFTFAPVAINTTTSSASITVTAQASDDLSGVAAVAVYFSSPSGQHSLDGSLNLISGTNLNGTYQGQFTFPAFSEPGTWTVVQVLVQDNVVNRSTYSTSQLQAMGFPTTLQVTSQEDITPPTLNGFTFTPNSINTTTSSASITVTAQASDNLSGVAAVAVYFSSPSGQHSLDGSLDLISGTNLNGTYQGQFNFPAFSEPGTWTVVQVLVQDNQVNRSIYSTSQLQAMGFPTTLQVTSQEDITPPTLNGFTFTPGSINTTSTSATVTATAQASDDLSGVAAIEVYFSSPSGKQNVDGSLDLISGTNLNGTYQGQLTFPAFGESGTWKVVQVLVQDNQVNRSIYSTSQLQALGYPTTLQVNSGTSVALNSSLNPSGYGQSVTFSATVTSGSGNLPTGSVNFTDGSTTLGTGVLNSSGIATLTTSALAVGNHSIVAAYLGDGNNPPSNSPALSQVVAKGTTTTSINSSSNPSTVGELVTFTATVVANGSDAVDQGVIAFSDGPRLLCRRNVIRGQAECNASHLSLGTHYVAARYLGGTNLKSSTASVKQVVQ